MPALHCAHPNPALHPTPHHTTPLHHCPLQAFAGRGELPDTALWPVAEFTGCGPDVGEYMFDWWSSTSNSEFSISNWYDQELQAITFAANGTLKLSYNLVSNVRVDIGLEYTDSKTRKLVSEWAWEVGLGG